MIKVNSKVIANANTTTFDIFIVIISGCYIVCAHNYDRVNQAITTLIDVNNHVCSLTYVLR